MGHVQSQPLHEAPRTSSSSSFPQIAQVLASGMGVIPSPPPPPTLLRQSAKRKVDDVDESAQDPSMANPARDASMTLNSVPPGVSEPAPAVNDAPSAHTSSSALAEPSIPVTAPASTTTTDEPPRKKPKKSRKKGKKGAKKARVAAASPVPLPDPVIRSIAALASLRPSPAGVSRARCTVALTLDTPAEVHKFLAAYLRYMPDVANLQIMCMVHLHQLNPQTVATAVAHMQAATEVGLEELAWNTIDPKPNKLLAAFMRLVPSARARASAISFPQNLNPFPFVNLTQLRLLTDLNGGYVGSCRYGALNRLYTALRDLSMDAPLEDTMAGQFILPHTINLDVLRMDQTAAYNWEARRTAATVANLRVHRIPLVLVIEPLVDMLVVAATQRNSVAATPIDHLVVVTSSKDMCRVGMAHQQDVASHRSLYDEVMPSCILALARSEYYGALTRMTLMLFLPHDAIRALFSTTPTVLRRLLLVVPGCRPSNSDNLLTWRDKDAKWECALKEVGITTAAPSMLKTEQLPSLDDLYEGGRDKRMIPILDLHGFVRRHRFPVTDYFFGNQFEFYEGWAHAKYLLGGEHHFM